MMVDNIQTYLNDARHLTRRTHFDTERMAGTVPVWESNATLAQIESKPTPTGHVLTSRDIGAEIAAGKPPSFGFGELLDVVNPLHHIPIVGGLYRQWTGDDISSVAKIAGGGIYGGPIGFAASIAYAAIEEHSGETMVENIVSNAFNGVSNGNQNERKPQTQKWHFNT